MAQGKKKKGGMTMSKEVFKFIGYDWIFLIYTCVFCASIIYDIVCLSVGAADGAFCLGMLGNILSAILHFLLRILLCCMGCCVLFQVQCSENPLCTPILSCISCGLINPEKRRKLRQRRAEIREARQNNEQNWMNA